MRRTHVLQIRLSPRELNLLRTAAKAAHLDLSTWIRQQALIAASQPPR